MEIIGNTSNTISIPSGYEEALRKDPPLAYLVGKWLRDGRIAVLLTKRPYGAEEAFASVRLALGGLVNGLVRRPPCS